MFIRVSKVLGFFKWDFKTGKSCSIQSVLIDTYAVNSVERYYRGSRINIGGRQLVVTETFAELSAILEPK